MMAAPRAIRQRFKWPPNTADASDYQALCNTRGVLLFLYIKCLAAGIDSEVNCDCFYEKNVFTLIEYFQLLPLPSLSERKMYCVARRPSVTLYVCLPR